MEQMDENRSPDSESWQKLEISEVLELSGGYGRFQIAMSFICVLSLATDAWTSVDVFFSAKIPEWRCASNSTLCNSTKIFNEDDLLRCQLPRSDWLYTKPKSYSMVTDFDIDCSDDWQLQLASMVYFLGAIVSASILGWISDNFGRKRLLIPGMFIHLLASVLRGFAANIWTAIALRLVSGMASVTGVVQMQVLGSEFVSPKYRSYVGPVLTLTYPLGRSLLCLTAYLSQEWRLTIFAGLVPFFLVYVFLFFLPESVYWLTCKGRQEEAINILRRIARFNKRELSHRISIRVEASTGQKAFSTPLDLLSSWQIARKTLVICFAFFSVNAVYYTLALAADDLSAGSMYLNFFLLTLIEVPGLLISAYVMDRFGPKRACCISLFMTSLTLVVVSAIPNTSDLQDIRLSVGLIGNLFAAIQFMAIYVWTMALYPTLLRNQALGIGFAFGKIGSSACRWIAKGSKKIHVFAPFTIMAVVALTAAILGAMLPERLEHMCEKQKDEVRTTNTNLGRS